MSNFFIYSYFVKETNVNIVIIFDSSSKTFDINTNHKLFIMILFSGLVSSVVKDDIIKIPCVIAITI